MISRTLSAAFLVVLLYNAASAAPSTINSAFRQDDGVVLAVMTSGPIAVSTIPEVKVLPPPGPTPVSVPAEETPTEILSDEVEVPIASAEPLAASPEEMDVDASLEEDTLDATAEEDVILGDAPAFAYNIGGPSFGIFAADPIDYLVGETESFQIPGAEIVETQPGYADVYQSHRYGLLGSTWGYDLPVSSPGIYECTLHYAEIYSEFFSAEPNRTFAVGISGDASGEVQTAEFDVMVELQGAEFTAYTRTFSNIAVANTLSIRETPSIGNAFLSGISCVYSAAIEIAV